MFDNYLIQYVFLFVLGKVYKIKYHKTSYQK